jgi:hypothetical protein
MRSTYKSLSWCYLHMYVASPEHSVVLETFRVQQDLQRDIPCQTQKLLNVDSQNLFSHKLFVWWAHPKWVSYRQCYITWNKAVLLQPCSRQEGEEKGLLLILDLGTRWGWDVSNTPQPPFTTGNGPFVHIGKEAGWASKLVWTQRLEEKAFASAMDRTPVVQSAVRLSYPSSQIMWKQETKGVTRVMGEICWPIH